MKNIETDIDSVERVGHSEGPAVTKAEVGIPLAIKAKRKQQGAAGTDHDSGELQKPGREIETGLRDGIGCRQKSGPSCPTASAKGGAVSDSLTEIDPQIQKGEDERRAKHRPPNRQQRPEDAGVVELPHPEPFLQVAGDDSQDEDQ